MRRHLLPGLAVCLALAMAPAHAAFVIEIDVDGDASNASTTFNSNFALGGDTTSASASSASNAVGLTPANSIFGGNGMMFADTYTATYTPAVDGDNVNLGGIALNDDGDIGNLQAAGGSGVYDIYATWPITNNVSGGLTNYRLNDGSSDILTTSVDQNTVQGFVDPTNGMTFAGGEWIFLGSATLDANTTYTLFQETSNNTFVSMRASGYLFDAQVPEPATVSLAVLASLGFVALRRRK